MNTESASDRNVGPNDNQRAVAGHPDLERYHRAEHPANEKMPPVGESRSDFKDRRLEPEQKSLIAGIAGLAVITLLLGISVPMEVHLLNEFNIGRPTYVWMMMMVQSMLLPPMVGFSFAAVTPMFWYGSIILRFAMASVAVLPGCLGFAFTLITVENGAPSDFLHAFSMVMFTCLMTIATVALTTQLWSRWTLSHARVDVTPLPPTGIVSMIELTGVAAVGCAIFMSNNFLDYLQGMYLFGGIAFMAAIAIICTQIAFLREGPRSRAATVASFAFAFAAAFVLNSFFGVMEFGWDVLASELLLISAASLYGSFLICAPMWVCLRWLRFCGWRCIDRRSSRLSRKPRAGSSASGPKGS